ncbi:DNA helicase [Ranunculus cassubicifolius]
MSREIDTIESATYGILEKKLKGIGIDSVNCKIGEYNRLMCPECEGGDSNERSFSLYITPDANLAMWQCYRAKCGWRGHLRAFENGKAGFSKLGDSASVKRTRIITEESIGLEPLCKELVEYFEERMISGETLRRNGVMQKTGSEQVAIAFTYRRNGVLVSCKYRDINKKFWQKAKWISSQWKKQASPIVLVCLTGPLVRFQKRCHPRKRFVLSNIVTVCRFPELINSVFHMWRMILYWYLG